MVGSIRENRLKNMGSRVFFPLLYAHNQGLISPRRVIMVKVIFRYFDIESIDMNRIMLLLLLGCVWLPLSGFGQQEIKTFKQVSSLELTVDELKNPQLQESSMFQLEDNILRPHQGWTLYQNKNEWYLLPKSKVYAGTLRLYSWQKEEDDLKRIYMCMDDQSTSQSKCNMIFDTRGIISCQSPCLRLTIVL